MWLAEVKAKAKRRNQILFAADDPLLAELRRLIAGAILVVSDTVTQAIAAEAK